MYANQFAADRGFKPGSMTLALAMTALPIVGLIVTTQADRIKKLIEPPITIVDIRPLKDPPPDPKPKPKTADPIDQKIYVPPIENPTPSDNKVITIPTFPETPPPPIPSGTGTELLKPPVTPPKPVIIDSLYDQRYANALQPPYPSSEVRAGNTGRVVIKVLIGTDGRVKQVERVSAASEAFFAAAEKQALTKWRFKPATSDGTPIEQWKTMALRFELQDQ